MSHSLALPTLVSAADLSAALADPEANIRVLDATTFLHTTEEGVAYTASSGYEGYLSEHLAGALFADITGEFSDPDADQLFTVPSPERLAQAAQKLGIGSETHVVVYDTVGVAWATRAWWLFRLFGHDAVSVLDGGLGAWKAEGLEVSSGVADTERVTAQPAPTFTPAFREHLVATKAEVIQTLPGTSAASANTVVVNALDPATFTGDSELSPYTRRGRIPGSRNLPLYTLLDPATGRFLPEDEITAKLQDQGLLDAERAITYCGGGIAATLPAFAAFLVAGAEVAVYDGSLSEWTADASLPVAVG